MEGAKPPPAMALDAKPNNNKSSKSRWRQRNRRGGKSKNRGNKTATNPTQKKPREPPPSPVLKVIVRNIANADLHGMVETVGCSIRALLQVANEKLTSAGFTTMRLDEDSLKQLIADEKAALEMQAKWHEMLQQQQQQLVPTENGTSESAGTAEDAAAAAIANQQVEATTDAAKYLNAAVENLKIDDEHAKHAISTRVMTVTPPRKTRRRGEKAGVAYLLLTAPPIETLAPVLEHSAAGNTNKSNAPPVVDYWRDVAKRRLMLRLALEALQQVVVSDTTTTFANWMVEEARNIKIVKGSKATANKKKNDRNVGTVFASADYRAYVENAAKVEEDRKARPKPAPGGGLPASGNAEGAGDPVAAIVLHLQQKKEEAKKRKQAKRKAKESTKKKVKPEKQSQQTEEASNTNQTEKTTTLRKRQRRARRRKNGENGKKPQLKSG